MKLRMLRPLAVLFAFAFLFSCAGVPPQGNMPAPAESRIGGIRSGDQAINRNNIDAILNNPDRSTPPKEERPGLATGWGQEKRSEFSRQAFTRASSKPAGTDIVYYNDKKGLDAMDGERIRVEGLQTAAGDLVEWGVKGRMGFLPTYKAGYSGFLSGSYYGRRLVAGESGGTYSIYVKNRCKSALEIVASVDGLDVIDGKRASYGKKGYVVNPGETIEIEGFRTSQSTVAAFKFSSVANSYSNMRHGETRNVGVIGIAVFTQKGVSPWTWMPSEIKKRDTANPFSSAPN